METIVPYKIMSFDIEASSSHGDFPVPIKSYKKLATNIIEYFESLKMDMTIELCKNILRRIILSAFGYDKMDQIDLVYPKIKPKSKEEVNKLCEIWLESQVRNFKTDEHSNTNSLESMFEKMAMDEDEEDNYKTHVKAYADKKATIVDMNKRVLRIHYDEAIETLGTCLDTKSSSIELQAAEARIKELEEKIIEADFVHFLAFDIGGSMYMAKYQNTFDFISNNIKIMNNTFDLLKKYNKPFIFASSQMSNMSYSTYGTLKAIGEKYTEALGGIIVKFWNVYGYETDMEKSHVINAVSAIQKEG
jgi:hypothetical protein